MKGASLGQALALPANIRLGGKSLPGANTLAYFAQSLGTKKNVYNTDTKSPMLKNFLRQSNVCG
jgi:hypothetical protein